MQEFIQPFAGMRVLDIGCGPADILAYLPQVEYWGFDISADYIARAQARFGERGRFTCHLLRESDLPAMPEFDVVLALGVLHHLDDQVAAQFVQLAHKALRTGGRLLTIDPCLDPSQNWIARFLIRQDRGQNVRDRTGYATLAQAGFRAPRVEVRHIAWIPYTHCYLECRK